MKSGLRDPFWVGGRGGCARNSKKSKKGDSGWEGRVTRCRALDTFALFSHSYKGSRYKWCEVRSGALGTIFDQVWNATINVLVQHWLLPTHGPCSGRTVGPAAAGCSVQQCRRANVVFIGLQRDELCQIISTRRYLCYALRVLYIFSWSPSPNSQPLMPPHLWDFLQV